MAFLDLNCNSTLGRIFNSDCPGIFASDLDNAIYKASNGNLTLYAQAKAASDAEQSNLDNIHFQEQISTLAQGVSSIGGKVALGLGVGSGAVIVGAGLLVLGYMWLEGKAVTHG